MMRKPWVLTTLTTLSTDYKLSKIMQGISSVQSTVQNFQSNFNLMVNKCSQLENEVRQNRQYITDLNGDINAIDKVATAAYNAIKVAELDVQKIHSTLATSDTQFFGRKAIISGIPAHCQLQDRELACIFLVAINAQHLMWHITDVRKLKSKNRNSEDQEYYKLVIKFSSFQIRKDIMIFKRRRGKVVYQDLFPPTMAPLDPTKILYFNDLLPAELYKRYTQIVNFF